VPVLLGIVNEALHPTLPEYVQGLDNSDGNDDDDDVQLTVLAFPLQFASPEIFPLIVLPFVALIGSNANVNLGASVQAGPLTIERAKS
jgi:hypothetical protein